MNLREAIGEFAVGYAQCQEVIGMEGEGVEKIRMRFDETHKRLDREVAMAEAAVAYAEYVTSNSGANFDRFLRELCRLQAVFLEARAKAAEQS